MKIEIKCTKHPSYQAKRAPVECYVCLLIFNLLNQPSVMGFTERLKVTRMEGA